MNECRAEERRVRQAERYLQPHPIAPPAEQVPPELASLHAAVQLASEQASRVRATRQMPAASRDLRRRLSELRGEHDARAETRWRARMHALDRTGQLITRGLLEPPHTPPPPAAAGIISEQLEAGVGPI